MLPDCLIETGLFVLWNASKIFNMQICLPAQLATPSPVYPGLHMQEYNPGSLVQVAFSWQSCAWLLSDVVHSSISTKKKDIGQQKKKGGRYLRVYEDTIHSSIFKLWTHHKAEIPFKAGTYVLQTGHYKQTIQDTDTSLVPIGINGILRMRTTQGELPKHNQVTVPSCCRKCHWSIGFER